MKQTIYISLFTLVTLLVSFVLHALLEIAVLSLLTNNLNIYGDSYLWQNWHMIHKVFGISLTIIALALGLVGGWRCWQILYIEERFGKPRL